MSEENKAESQSESAQEEPKRIVLKPVTVIVYLTVTLFIIAVLLLPYLQTEQNLPWVPFFSLTPEPTSIEDAVMMRDYSTPDRTPIPSATLPYIQTDSDFWSHGLIILALQDGLESHLFAYQPVPDQSGKSLGLIRITEGSWQDIDPEIHPEFYRLASDSDS